MTLCICTVATRLHRAAARSHHLAPPVPSLMKKVFYRLLALFISFSDTGEAPQPPALWYDERPLCLPALLFRFCSIICFSAFSVVVQKSREWEERAAERERRALLHDKQLPGHSCGLDGFWSSLPFIGLVSSFLNMWLCPFVVPNTQWPRKKLDLWPLLCLDEQTLHPCYCFFS